MQQKTFYLPLILSAVVGFLFVRKVRGDGLSKYKKDSGGFCWSLLLFDFLFWIGFALCGYYLVIVAFEFTPLLQSYQDYKYISAFIFNGVLGLLRVVVCFQINVKFFRYQQWLHKFCDPFIIPFILICAAIWFADAYFKFCCT